MINIFQPSLGTKEIENIESVFRTNWIGKGTAVLEFEKLFAKSLRTEPHFFTSTTCCTEGIFLATELLGIGEGDEVIVPTCSFVAVGSAVIASGAKLVLCDVDPHTMNVRVEDISEKLTTKTKAVYVTHYGGVACDMDPIIELCRSRQVKVIEDAACAVRSFYKGRACGTLADIGLWSFDAMKTICTGDGGMLYLCTQELVETAKESLYLGLPNKQKSGMDSSTANVANWWEYQVTRPGRRAIMNNIAGAIGLAQMVKLPTFLARRRAIHERYIRELSDIEWLVLPPVIPANCESSYYFLWVQTNTRDRLARHLLDQGVYTTFRYWPLHMVDYFSARSEFNTLLGADYACQHTLNLPLHQSLSDDDVTKVIDLIHGYHP